MNFVTISRVGLRLLVGLSLLAVFAGARASAQTVRLGAASYTVSEPAGKVTIMVLRGAPLTNTVGVTLATSDGTASNGVRYTAVTTNLTFAPHQSLKTVVIPIINDTLALGNQSFTVGLSGPTGGATLGTVTNAAVKIIDDDHGGTVQFTAPTFTTTETNGSVRITVTRVGGLASGVSVQYATADGTATNGVNYTAVSGALVFTQKQTSASFAVPVLNDGVVTSNLTVKLALSNPLGGATLGLHTTAVLTVKNVPPGAGTLALAGWAAWKTNDLAGAKSKFSQALLVDPKNNSANLGLSLATLLLLSQDTNAQTLVSSFGLLPPTVNNLMDAIGQMIELGNKHGFSLSLGKPASFPAPISNAQAVVASSVLPAVQQALTSIKAVQKQNFTFALTPDLIWGGSTTKTVVLDDGEFYLISALLGMLQGQLDLATAYWFDVDETQYYGDSLSILNGPNGVATPESSQFFKLKSDGATRLQAALAAFAQATLDVESCYNFLKTDPDRTTDHGLQLHASAAEQTQFTKNLALVKSGLVSRGVVAIMSGGQTIHVKPSQFFLSPLTRTDLPVLGYDLAPDPTLSELVGHAVAMPLDPSISPPAPEYLGCDIVAKSTLADPTLHGLLPDGVWHLPDMLHDGLLPLKGAFALTNEFGVWTVTKAADGVNLLAAIHTGTGQIYTISTNGFVSAAITPAVAIEGMTMHNGSLWVAETWSANLDQLNPDGSVTNTIALTDADFVSAVTSDGTVLWVAYGYYDQASDNEIMAIRSYNPATSLFGTPIFTTCGSAAQTAGVKCGDSITGLAFDGTNLLVGLDSEWLLKLARTGSVLSGRGALGGDELGTGYAFINGYLFTGCQLRIHVFQP